MYPNENRDLFIYHPGTGTAIMLTDPVYLVNAATVIKKAPGAIEAFEEGYATHDDANLMGIRIDNKNMGDLFGIKE